MKTNKKQYPIMLAHFDLKEKEFSYFSNDKIECLFLCIVYLQVFLVIAGLIIWAR